MPPRLKAGEAISTPDPSTFSLVALVVRGTFQFCAGIGLISGVYVTDNNVLAITSVLVGIATLSWSWYDKILTARARHTVAVISADRAIPVKLTWRTTP